MRFQKLMWHGIIRLTKRKTTLVVYMDACDYLKQCTFNMCLLLLMRMLDRDDEPKSSQLSLVI